MKERKRVTFGETLCEHCKRTHWKAAADKTNVDINQPNLTVQRCNIHNNNRHWSNFARMMHNVSKLPVMVK